MYKQKYAYGCGMYAVANSLNLTTFVTEERLEISKGGNNPGQLSSWLQQDGHNYWMQPLFFDMNALNLPYNHTQWKAADHVLATPIIITVFLSEGGLQHMIAGHLDTNKNLFVYDSLKDGVLITTLEKLHNHYYAVYGVFTFADLNTSDPVVIG